MVVPAAMVVTDGTQRLRVEQAAWAEMEALVDQQRQELAVTAAMAVTAVVAVIIRAESEAQEAQAATAAQGEAPVLVERRVYSARVEQEAHRVPQRHPETSS